jgi:hypothetical protein
LQNNISSIGVLFLATMFFVFTCTLDTDVSIGVNTFFGIISLLSVALFVYYAINIFISTWGTALESETRKASSALQARSNIRLGSTSSKSRSQPFGAIRNQCAYHGPILAGEHHKTRQEMLPMERFMDETSSQANALFTRADNWKTSLDKGCMCEIASWELSISADA